MDRIWQWAWDRYGPRYSWVMSTFFIAAMLPPYLFWSLVVVGVDNSRRYVEAAAITVGFLAVLAYLIVLPGQGRSHLVEQWAAGREVDRARALSDTYTWGREMSARGLISNSVGVALLLVVVGVITGATGSRLLQFGVMGVALGVAVQLMGMHSVPEGALRPAREAIAGDVGIGDSLPRSRPSFATWSNLSMLATTFAFTAGGVSLASTLHLTGDAPLMSIVIGGLSTLAFVPLTIGAIFSPSMLPIRDLAEGTRRVAAGDYSQRLPVAQDDDLGALAASFNRMQAGLAERQRLQAAFGTYVDPTLAARLLGQGDDVFTGERREVTVMFIDIRDFTPFAEANTAEDTVARLNALFEIVVPAVVDAGGHVNKFLGDGALAVFNAPNDLPDHADAALRAAVVITRRVVERFGQELRIGIGINTGMVIAGTIGGGGKLEFTLIGDTVNVAARVEQLTKTTTDAILLTKQCVEALVSRPPALIDRGLHVLKGKSASVQVFALSQEADGLIDLTR
jgi:adenylate cyclase